MEECISVLEEFKIGTKELKDILICLEDKYKDTVSEKDKKIKALEDVIDILLSDMESSYPIDIYNEKIKKIQKMLS